MDLYSLIQGNGMGLEGYNGEDTTHGIKELAEEGDSVTLGTGSATVGNGEHDTTLVLPEVWDRLQGPDCDARTATRLAQLLNRAGNHSNSSVVFFGFQDQLLPKDAE